VDRKGRSPRTSPVPAVPGRCGVDVGGPSSSTMAYNDRTLRVTSAAVSVRRPRSGPGAECPGQRSPSGGIPGSRQVTRPPPRHAATAGHRPAPPRSTRIRPPTPQDSTGRPHVTRQRGLADTHQESRVRYEGQPAPRDSHGDSGRRRCHRGQLRGPRRRLCSKWRPPNSRLPDREGGAEAELRRPLPDRISSAPDLEETARGLPGRRRSSGYSINARGPRAESASRRLPGVPRTRLTGCPKRSCAEGRLPPKHAGRTTPRVPPRKR